MLLPVAIHKDDGSVYGVTVPDVPGCFSCGDTVQEAIQNAQEAVKAHVEILLEEGGEPTVTPSSIEELQTDTAYAGAVWAFIDVDLSKMTSKPERFNVSWPSFVLSRVDEFVARNHESRSGFLARAAMDLISRDARHAR